MGMPKSIGKDIIEQYLITGEVRTCQREKREAMVVKS
jgi:hypothetical protein